MPRDIDIEVTDDNEEVRISIKAASPKSEFRAWLTPEHARGVGAALMKMADRIEGHNLTHARPGRNAIWRQTRLARAGQFPVMGGGNSEAWRR